MPDQLLKDLWTDPPSGDERIDQFINRLPAISSLQISNDLFARQNVT